LFLLFSSFPSPRVIYVHIEGEYVSPCEREVASSCERERESMGRQV
jgi:hypothetical protein